MADTPKPTETTDTTPSTTTPAQDDTKKAPAEPAKADDKDKSSKDASGKKADDSEPLKSANDSVVTSKSMSVCIVTDNQGIIQGNPLSEVFYKALETYLKKQGATAVKRDPGADFTVPPIADFWIGHGDGCKRRKFMAPTDQDRFIQLSCIDGIIADDDLEWQKRNASAKAGTVAGAPPASHFKLNAEQQEAIKDMISRVHRDKATPLTN